MKQEDTDRLNELASHFSLLAKKSFFEFIEKKEEIEKRIDSTPIVALIWGPGEKTEYPYLYKLRLDIKDELIKLGNAAFFSEDLGEKTKPTTQTGISELAQAIAADIIILVLAPWGSEAEAAKYGIDAEIASKILIITNEQLRDSITEMLLINEVHPDVLYFNEKDLKSGMALNKVIEILPKLKFSKVMYLRQKRRWGDDKIK
jgi:hypothetical protein